MTKKAQETEDAMVIVLIVMIILGVGGALASGFVAMATIKWAWGILLG